MAFSMKIALIQPIADFQYYDSWPIRSLRLVLDDQAQTTLLSGDFVITGSSIILTKKSPF